MPREIDFFGVYFPSLLLAFLIAIPVFWVFEGLLARAGLYRWVWHIDLFRASLFIVMFTALGLFWYR